MMLPHDPSSLQGLPLAGDSPVFNSPWEAQAFALVLALREKGLFTWSEWAASLATEIKAAQAAGDADTGATYYRHWLETLERLVVDKGITTRTGLESLADAWDRAAKATPHGQPIVLPTNDFSHDPQHPASAVLRDRSTGEAG